MVEFGGVIRLRKTRDPQFFCELGNAMGYTGKPVLSDNMVGYALVRRYTRAFGELGLKHLQESDSGTPGRQSPL